MNRTIFLIIILLALLTSCTAKRPADSSKRKQNDTTVEEEKNMNGQVVMSTTYVNGVMEGPYKMYYDDGTLFAQGNHANGKLYGEVRSYTPEGKLAAIEIWDTVPNSSKPMSQLVTEQIFWCEIPTEDDKYLFVSDSGYYRIKDGIPQNDTTKIPDNMVDMRGDKNGTTIWIWKKGKREFYKYVSAH